MGEEKHLTKENMYSMLKVYQKDFFADSNENFEEIKELTNEQAVVFFRFYMVGLKKDLILERLTEAKDEHEAVELLSNDSKGLFISYDEIAKDALKATSEAAECIGNTSAIKDKLFSAYDDLIAEKDQNIELLNKIIIKKDKEASNREAYIDELSGFLKLEKLARGKAENKLKELAGKVEEKPEENVLLNLFPGLKKRVENKEKESKNLAKKVFFEKYAKSGKYDKAHLDFMIKCIEEEGMSVDELENFISEESTVQESEYLKELYKKLCKESRG